MEPLVVKFQKLTATASLPQYMTAAASGLDLVADVKAPISIPSAGRQLIPTGLSMELPPGFEAQIRPRSGLALKHGVTVLNAPGTIDADYRGEIQVLLINHGSDPFWVSSGDRIAQLIIASVVQSKLVEAKELSATDRGAGGYGHTGTGPERR